MHENEIETVIVDSVFVPPCLRENTLLVAGEARIRNLPRMMRAPCAHVLEHFMELIMKGFLTESQRHGDA